MDSEAVSEIKSILVEHWEEAFHVEESGGEIRVYVEMNDTSLSTNLWKHVPMRFEKKSVLIFKVPTGYTNVLRSKDQV